MQLVFDSSIRAAHELRIPVTIVNRYCTLLREMGTVNLTSQQLEFLAAAIESSDRLVNLISNAVKYTPAGGRVRVVLCKEEGEVSVSVEDTGRGIQRERLPELFDEFAQIGPADTGKGSGLGLSICKKIIDSHQGRIWAESAPGQGSRFTFSLPKSSSAVSFLSFRPRNS